MISWLIAILALTGTILNIRKKRICFLFWLISNTSFAIIDFRAGLPAQGWLFVIYAILAVWGLISWRKE